MTNPVSFAEALTALKAGKRVSREGWNGNGMWLVLISQSHYDVAVGKAGGASHLKPWIALKTADNGLVPWQASQTDVLAEDWLIEGGR